MMPPHPKAGAASEDRWIHTVPHPSVLALYDALEPKDWEGLAVLAAEGVLTTQPPTATLERLAGFGAIANGMVTSTGYALLLAWHRRHQWMTWQARFKATREELKHFNRMRLLLDGASTDYRWHGMAMPFYVRPLRLLGLIAVGCLVGWGFWLIEPAMPVVHASIVISIAIGVAVLSLLFFF